MSVGQNHVKVGQFHSWTFVSMEEFPDSGRLTHKHSMTLGVSHSVTNGPMQVIHLEVTHPNHVSLWLWKVDVHFPVYVGTQANINRRVWSRVSARKFMADSFRGTLPALQEWKRILGIGFCHIFLHLMSGYQGCLSHGFTMFQGIFLAPSSNAPSGWLVFEPPPWKTMASQWGSSQIPGD
jgi:hypothetical protein